MPSKRWDQSSTSTTPSNPFADTHQFTQSSNQTEGTTYFRDRQAVPPIARGVLPVYSPRAAEPSPAPGDRLFSWLFPARHALKVAPADYQSRNGTLRSSPGQSPRGAQTNRSWLRGIMSGSDQNAVAPAEPRKDAALTLNDAESSAANKEILSSDVQSMAIPEMMPRKNSSVRVAPSAASVETPPTAETPAATFPTMRGTGSESHSTASLSHSNTYQVDFNRPNSTLFQEFRYPSNYIRTNKYTLFSFLPLNLFGQFRRLSNLYFLLGAIFSLVGEQTVSAFAQVAPLIFVLTATAIKDGIEDYSRHKADQLANNTPLVIVKQGKQETVKTMDLVPGDIVFLKKGEKVPADIVLLSTSYEDGNCFVETSELDGETALKRRNALHETMHAGTNEGIACLAGRIQCEFPNENLNKFEGRLCLQQADGTDKVVPLNMAQILLRGSYLRNTDFCYGVVVFAGVETKIFKNLKQSGLKFSTLEKTLNRIVFIAFVYNVLMLAVSMAFFVQVVPTTQTLWYLNGSTGAASLSLYFDAFMSFFVLYSYTIPVSLFVLIEAVRIAQRQFMVWDEYLKSPQGQAMKVNNSNLNEDLGSVQFVFSDKTGTLTRNEMVLTHVSIAGKVVRVHALKNMKSDPDVHRLARCIALCNSAVPVESDGQDVNTASGYESQSPDEIALLMGVRHVSKLKLRKKSSVVVEEGGKQIDIPVLDILEFNSDRKRMSVIVREEDGNIVMYTKGADNIIRPRLANTDDSTLVRSTEGHLNTFSEQGLRTLMLAYRIISEDEYRDFKKRSDEAARALVDRQGRMDKVSDLCEQNLTLIGCSAIEDRLQDQVPETIDYLMKCGIRVWLLTGDKQETAINIGHSCRLLRNSTQVLTLDAKSISIVQEQMIEYCNAADQPNRKPLSLVVSGESLAMVLEMCPGNFLKLAMACEAVICCRVTPLQKALVVRLVKRELGLITLSIGDGANDVSMIQEADIGVGIEGREGAQAVRAADYAFVEFKSLARLLSVHGRYSLLRLSNLVFYSFYKNIVFISIQFVFGKWNLWSAGAYYNGVFLPDWNVLYTLLPPFFYAFLEKDVPEDLIKRYPALYDKGRNAYFWNPRLIMTWGLSFIWHSAVQLFVGLIVYDISGGVFDQGRGTDINLFQWIGAICVLNTVTIKIALKSKYWTWITAAGIFLSLAVYIATVGGLEILTLIKNATTGYGAVDDLPVGTTAEINSCSVYWLLAVLVPVLANLPDYIITYIQTQERPSDVDILREMSVATPKIMDISEEMPERSQITSQMSGVVSTSTAHVGPSSANVMATATALAENKGTLSTTIPQPQSSIALMTLQAPISTIDRAMNRQGV